MQDQVRVSQKSETQGRLTCSRGKSAFQWGEERVGSLFPNELRQYGYAHLVLARLATILTWTFLTGLRTGFFSILAKRDPIMPNHI